MLYLSDKYLDWMRSILKTNDINPDDYANLFQILNLIPFRYTDPMDENRESDGKSLRYRFGAEKRIPDRSIDGILGIMPCSVLEMMVALSIRSYEEVTSGFPYPISPGEIFWMMINNVGLIRETNDQFSERYIFRQINRMLNREYSKDGKGGLFYIKDTTRDMRNADIWYQMQWWASNVWNSQTELQKSSEEFFRRNQERRFP